METKGITCKIPLELHQQIKEEQERLGITMNQYIEMVLREHFTPKGEVNMGKTRTLAFQVSEELFEKVKDYLTRYEQAYGRRLTQKEFVISLIENALEEAEDEFIDLDSPESETEDDLEADDSPNPDSEDEELTSEDEESADSPENEAEDEPEPDDNSNPDSEDGEPASEDENRADSPESEAGAEPDDNSPEETRATWQPYGWMANIH